MIDARQVILNDNPVLRDNVDSYNWWLPPADIYAEGYGENGFWFTLAIGDSDEVDSWARWDFNPVEGRYAIEVFVPAKWSTAYVQYNIWADENNDGTFDSTEYVAGPWLDQQLEVGWARIGTYDLEGRVRIEVRDSLARDDFRTDGPIETRIAADAIRLIRVN